MNSLEFTTKIEHGVIHLPKEFEEYENEIAHVVITVETSEERKRRKINYLLLSKKHRKPTFSKTLKTLLRGREN